MIRIAGVQFAGHADKKVNIATATRLVRKAADAGAQMICLPELFSTIYFCVETRQEYFEWAETIPGPTIETMAALARETSTLLVCPIFERAGDGRFYNSAAVLGPDGVLLGKYRKASIPFMDRSLSAEPRGDEKFYFQPGDLGFPTFATPFGVRIGILICYDRHFPEAARILGLGGAEIVFVPTVTSGMTRHLWDLELRAHAATNIYYVCGVNKAGVDVGGSTRFHFGSSLVANPRGEIIAQASDTGEDMVIADVDPSVIPQLRAMWGYYRDRRPDLYGPLADGRVDTFFYGLFMDADILRESKVVPVNPRRAYVDDFALRIGQRATLLPCPGARAYGMLIALTYPELERLYAAPGLEPYRPEAVLARPLDGPPAPALCYTLREAPGPGERNPEYAARLQQVLGKLHFPPEYVASVSRAE